MQCTKCGRDVADSAVFCDLCLEVMAKYPVKVGTALQLPQRKAEPPKKQSRRRRQYSPEEQVVRQKKTIRWLRLSLTASILLLALCAAFLFQQNHEITSNETIGQNYMTRSVTPP